MHSNTLAIQLVSWNMAPYVPFLVHALAQQTYRDYHLYIYDNHSNDATVAQLKATLETADIQYTLILGTENRGFAGGHNALLQEHNAKFVLLLNPDLFFAPDCIEKLVTAMKNAEDIATLSPRLMRWQPQFNATPESQPPGCFTDTVDAIGMQVFRNRRVLEGESGTQWNDIKSRISSPLIPTFGVSGTMPLFRREALTRVAFADGTVFDELYHSYKEDVDLAYRLNSAGFTSAVARDIVAYHDRTSAAPQDETGIAAIQNKRKNHSDRINYYSYRNHLYTLYKNEYWQNALLDIFYIKIFELQKWGYYIVTNPKILIKTVRDFIHDWPELHRKKKEIQKKRTRDWRAIREMIIQ